MKFNINDEVVIKLTKYGETILGKSNSTSYEYSYNKKTKILKEQLWVVMNIFGNHLWLGGEQMFVNNIIELKGE